jgi:hypothetical protein
MTKTMLALATALLLTCTIAFSVTDAPNPPKVGFDVCNALGTSPQANAACRASLKNGPRTYRVNDDGLGVQMCMSILDPNLMNGVDTICK